MSELNDGSRMLFSFWDGGRCHLARTMSIAQEAQNQGIEVGFITSEKYEEDVGRICLRENIYIIPNRPSVTQTPPYAFPLYSHAFRHAQRLRGLGFDDTDWLMNTTQQEIDAIAMFKPDVIINDYRDTIRTSAEVCNIPIAAITHTTGNVDGFTFGWWETPPEDAVLPDCRDSFNSVRRSFGLQEILDEREMFSGDINCIPSIPEIDPLKNRSPNSWYVGMIATGIRKSNFAPIRSDGLEHKVYSYVGEPTRPQYGYENMLREAMQSDESIGYYVVGNPHKYMSPAIAEGMKQGRLIIDEGLPGGIAMEDSSLVLCHGGNGTVMSALASGKPLICVGPYHTDATSIFRQVESEGAGIMINHSDGPLQRIPAPDLGDDVSIFGYWETGITATSLKNAIQRALSDQSYVENSARLGRQLTTLGGARRVIELCEENFNIS